MATDPSELIEGLSDFLMEVGFSSSFLDLDEVKNRGEQPPLWQLMTRAIINPLSTENRIFMDNLTPLKEQTAIYKQYKMKEEIKMKRRQ